GGATTTCTPTRPDLTAISRHPLSGSETMPDSKINKRIKNAELALKRAESHRKKVGLSRSHDQKIHWGARTSPPRFDSKKAGPVEHAPCRCSDGSRRCSLRGQ